MLEEIPFLGAGLGFRQEFKEDILRAVDRIGFLELISDQYIDKSPIKEQEASNLKEKFPLVLHGVDLSIGTDSPTDEIYLEKIRRIAGRIKPHWVSDHLCFTRVPGMSLGQLTPVSFNENTVEFVVRHIKEVSAVFDCPFLVENISYYFLVPPISMTEAEFITRVIREAGCWLLLDITNVMNNATNNHYDPYEFLDGIPLDKVVQIHLAGGSYSNGIMLDTHSHPVHSDVFNLLRYAVPKMPELKGVSIERDQNFPPFEEILSDLDEIRAILNTNWMPYYSLKSGKDVTQQSRGANQPLTS